MKKISIALFILMCCFIPSAHSTDATVLPRVEKLRAAEYIKEVYAAMKHFYFKDITDKKVITFILQSQQKFSDLLDVNDPEYQRKLNDLMYWHARWLVYLLRDPSDTFSAFINKDEFDKFERKEFKSAFAGIGIEVRQEEDSYSIDTVYEDSSAARKGVRVGDTLVAISDMQVAGWSLADIEEKLMIPDGATVRVTLLHQEEVNTYSVDLVCTLIHRPSVDYEYLKEYQLAYFKITDFKYETAEEFKHYLADIRAREIRGIIIDVRNNRGGDTEQADPFLSNFLEKKSLIAYFLKRNVDTRQQYKTTENPLNLNCPIVVLMNKKTQSSAEIFAGVMRYYKKATLVGTQTQGLGLLKNFPQLRDGSRLYLITSYTYLPNGETFNGIGIIPDIVVEGEDEQMDAAINVIVQEAA